MSYRHFLDEIKKGMPLSNYVLISSDSFLRTEAIYLIKELMPAEERDFNFYTYDLQDNSVIPFEQILDVLNTAPFFSSRKFVIICNFQKISLKDLKKLEQYLLNPFDSSLMILLNAGAVKKDIRDRLRGVKQIILDIREKEIPLWLRQKARKKGFEISNGAADYLIGTIGPDIGMLSSELDKFMLLGKSVIEKEDIIEVIRGNRTFNAFDLVDAIKSRDTERVFKIYSILRDLEEPYSLLGALNWQYGQSLSVRSSRKERKYLADAFNILHNADVHIKSSGSYYPVELLLRELLRLSKQR